MVTNDNPFSQRLPADVPRTRDNMHEKRKPNLERRSDNRARAVLAAFTISAAGLIGANVQFDLFARSPAEVAIDQEARKENLDELVEKIKDYESQGLLTIHEGTGDTFSEIVSEAQVKAVHQAKDNTRIIRLYPELPIVDGVDEYPGSSLAGRTLAFGLRGIQRKYGDETIHPNTTLPGALEVHERAYREITELMHDNQI